MGFQFDLAFTRLGNHISRHEIEVERESSVNASFWPAMSRRKQRFNCGNPSRQCAAGRFPGRRNTTCRSPLELGRPTVVRVEAGGRAELAIASRGVLRLGGDHLIRGYLSDEVQIVQGMVVHDQLPPASAWRFSCRIVISSSPAAPS